MRNGTTKQANWPLPCAKPEEVGMSSERLARIGTALQRFIDDKLIVQTVTLVARRGKIVHFEAQGFMDLENKRPASKDTICRLWSNTKPITGVATMICMEEGLLKMDDPVSKYIPSFRNQGVRQGTRKKEHTTYSEPAIREVTIRDCITNTTGLPTAERVPASYFKEFADPLNKSGILGDPEKINGNIKEQVEAMGLLPLDFQPGTHYDYQIGFPVAGRILEIVTGKNLDEFYRERIFKPLKMKDSSYYLPKSKLDRFPSLYRPVQGPSGWKLSIVETPENSEKVVNSKNYYEAGGGGGGVLSTVADYSRFAQMLLNGGELEGARILGRKSVELMTSNHLGNVTMPDKPGYGFGMGIGVYVGHTVPTMRSIGTYGWSGAAGTTFFVDPRESLISICFSQIFTHNIRPDNTFQEEFERLVYQSLL